MSLYDEAVRHQVSLEEYKEGQIAETLLVTSLLLRSFIEDISGSGTTRLSELSWTQSQKLIKKILSNQNRIGKKQTTHLIKELTDLAGSEFVFLNKSFTNNGLPEVERPSKKRVYEEAEKIPLTDENYKLEDFLPFWIAAHSTRLRSTMETAWVRGTNNIDLISKIRGTRSRKYKDGLLGTPFKAGVSYVVSTAVQHISSTAQLWAMRLNPSVRGYRWVSVLDSLTSPICRSLSGREFEFGKGPRPPMHPRCRSTIVAITDATPDIPTSETYYGWLKRQPVAFQNRVLGPTRAKLLRNGGIGAKDFADLNLNRRFQPRTLKQMHDLEPTIFSNADVSA